MTTPDLPPPSPLTPAHLEEIRTELEEERTRLARQVSRARGTGTVTLDPSAVGRLSRMDALMNEGLSQASNARTVTELALIEDALSRLEAGSYGRCQACGQVIPYERLSVMPETRECAQCRR